ncbi:hypothetical protein PG991_005183 [Apiospora marii]|uniref:C2H2-type domain-containing protein n=1 Tax=Apiospora marii TaxID=335849 RepID=A0ABR1S8H8_9PEZI
MKKRKEMKGEKLARGGLQGYWKQFTAGYQHLRGPIEKDHITSVTRLLSKNGGLYEALDMVPDAGPRKHATEHVFIMLGKFLWTLDWQMFRYPHLRVDYWAAISAKVLTSSRISDFIESSSRPDTEIGLKYKDIKMVVFRNEEGQPEFAVQMTKFLKGFEEKSSKLTQCDLHEGEYGGSLPLFMNPILFLLVIFCTTGAFRDYRGIEGLYKLLDLDDIPPFSGFRAIQWNPEVRDTPVFRGAPQSTGEREERRMMKAHMLSKELRALGIRSGCPDPPTLHDFRAEGLTKIDMNTRYSETQRQRVAGHGTGQIFQQYYAARNPGVDTQGSYLGKTRLVTTADFFRHLEVEWEPDLWQTLPLAELEELEREVALVEQKQESVGTPGMLRPGDLDDDLWRDIKKKRLQSYWKRSARGAAAGDQEYVCRGVDYPYARQRPILPIRRRLADLLCNSARIRSKEGREVLDLLVRLYESDSEAYRPALHICNCAGLNVTELHVYQCIKKSRQFAEFCFFCNEWLFEAKEWEEHCSSHIKLGDVPMEMAYASMQKSFLPGYCPFCLGDEDRPAAERLVQFCKKEAWCSHIWDHQIRWEKRCPDGRCKVRFENQDSFVYHMHDMHRIPRDLFWGRAEGKGCTGREKARIEKVLDNGALQMECHTIMDM